MNLTFTQPEFDVLRKFQNRMNKEFGETAYVGANYATVVIEYSPQLVEMLRPLAKVGQFDYSLLQLTCEDCKCKQLFLCVAGETTFVCNDCIGRRRKKGQQKA